ncbi:plasmid stabilization protein [Paraburkholderia phenoliruptrix]|uniref:plasmid stabilization protein n=1 Tax=Paraburkholderia phenoliruptrix TaxID=252970 RepID=UPI002869AAAB|nr:plasmid stabilization protein [Paraburkholderia phenoliruptrix]WMY09539.1 plasmid stabilization protein [Paraburkholderia phenoliruptrix]
MRVRERLCVELGGMRPEWDRWCVRRGMTVGEGARQLIAAALCADADNGDPGIDADVRWSVVGDPRSRIELRLTPAELEMVGVRAEASGLTPNRWIVALIRAQLTHEPQFGAREMRLLSDSNLQLASISRWLGQLTRAGGAARFSQDSDGEIRAIRVSIDAHLRVVAAVMRANLDRWSR